MFTKDNYGFCKQLNQALCDLSTKIKPDETLIKRHVSYAQEILELLQSSSTYKIDRFSFSGSFGKRTNTMQSDADCVYFINDQEPPFDGVLKEFYGICNKPEVKNLFDAFSVKLKRKSLKFEIDGLEMDVVLATNFVNNKQKDRRSLHLIQQREALQRIKPSPSENSYKYSSALAEASVDFMKNRPGFANEMARIAKYWFQSLDRSFEHISGASTFIELVAVYAASKRARNPHLKAFIKFLEFLIDFENLDVSFGVSDNEIKNHLCPRVIDPVNHFNNFARYWIENRRDVDAIKISADSTLERIRRLILNFNLLKSTSAEDLTEAIFHP